MESIKRDKNTGKFWYTNSHNEVQEFDRQAALQRVYLWYFIEALDKHYEDNDYEWWTLAPA